MIVMNLYFFLVVHGHLRLLSDRVIASVAEGGKRMIDHSPPGAPGGVQKGQGHRQNVKASPADSRDVTNVSDTSASPVLNDAETEFLSSLWDGFDVKLPLKDSFLARKDKHRLRVVAGQTRKLQIFGMYDSGSNLLVELLRLNLGEMYEHVSPCGLGDCWIFKHAPPKVIFDMLHNRNDSRWRSPPDPDMVFIAITRAPLAQISGWIKASYAAESCVNTTDWLNDQASHCTIEGQEYSGATSIWNDYMSGYHRLLKEYSSTTVVNPESVVQDIGIGVVKIVEYENLVVNTESVVRDIVKLLGFNLGTFQNIESPAKEHGDPVGRDAAIAKIKDRTYLGDYPWSRSAYAEAVCGNLNLEMMLSHLIQFSPADERSYAADC